VPPLAALNDEARPSAPMSASRLREGLARLAWLGVPSFWGMAKPQPSRSDLRVTGPIRWGCVWQFLVIVALTAGCSGGKGDASGSGGASAGSGGRGGSGGQTSSGGASGEGSGGAMAPGGRGVGGASAGSGDGGRGGAMMAPGGSGGTAGGSGGVPASGGRGGTGGSPDASGGAPASGGRAGGGAGGGGSPMLTSFKLTVIGSSTAAGEGASSSAKSWVALLARSLDDAVVPTFTSSNLAVGGYTTVELLPGSNADGSIDDAISGRPNLILVSLAGSNDLSAGTSQSTFLSRLTSVRDTAQAAGVPVFFVSTAPKDLSDSERRALRDWATAMSTTFGTCWVPERATAYGSCFIDIFAPLANASLGVASAYGAGDGIHLNDAGHARIFEVAEAIVKPYVCSRVACR
jgi:lysophospholipase L1-like esterase